MRRNDMLLRIEEMLVELAEISISQAAESILMRLEKAGMRPPCVDSDRSQVLMQIYIDPSLNMWDEEFEKEPRLMEALKRRLKRKIK